MRPKKPSGVRKATLSKRRTRPRKPARVARSARTPKVARARTATSAKTATADSSSANAWALAIGAAGVVAVGLLVGLPSDDRTSTTLESASYAAPIQPVVPSRPALPVTNEPSQNFREPAPQTANKPAKANVTAAATAVTAVATLPAAEAVPVVETTELRHSAPPVVAARFEAPVEQPALVTITGCLETDDERFRLNDTRGSDAPKSRSWKSGFLRKRAAAIDVLDASGVGLPGHVGERVSLTGTLVDRNMHVRSLRRVAASCE
jgi:hypothetical protein